MGCTLVIDTSYGSTVGIVGHEPMVETDSRTHVERLRNNIAHVVDAAGATPADIKTIVVGVGPAPFTGLRAGIVTAKALAFATGAELIGRNVLEPQAQWNLIRRGKDGTSNDPGTRHTLTLAVNDARRRQLYFALCDDPTADGNRDATPSRPIIDMDIDYPASIVERVNSAVRAWRERAGVDVVVDVVGHGAARYADALSAIEHVGDIVDESVFDGGEQGLSVFASDALLAHERNPETPVEPLYLRRPDVSVPNPLKHVLNHAGAERTA